MRSPTGGTFTATQRNALGAGGGSSETFRGSGSDDTHLWAALQRASGGAWSGCVYDVDKIIMAFAACETAVSSSAIRAAGPG